MPTPIKSDLQRLCDGFAEEVYSALDNGRTFDEVSQMLDAGRAALLKRTPPGRAKPVQSPFNQEMAQSCWDQGFAAFHDGGPSNPYTSVAYAAAWRDGWEAASDEASDHAAKG